VSRVHRQLCHSTSLASRLALADSGDVTDLASPWVDDGLPWELVMNEADRHKRNQSRLGELYPTFRSRLVTVISELESHNLRPRIQDAWRSLADQRKAFESGHSKILFGFHNVTGPTGDPEALAVDLLDDDAPLSPGKSYLLRLAAAAEAASLTTGVRWGLPKKLAAAVDAAIATRDWAANVKIGWDPTHVQPIDITVSEARTGKRPA